MNQDVSTWSYRPGEWLAIFGTATTLLLPASEKARAAELWDLVDGGAGFAETLDRVLAPGLSVLPAFVLIGTGEEPTRAIVRGAGVRATLTTDSETVELDGSSLTTWVERTLDGVTTLTVELDDGGADGPDYLIDGGLVRVARVDLPPYAAPSAPADDPAAVPADQDPDDAGVIAAPVSADQPQTELFDVEAEAEAAPESAPQEVDAEDGDTTDVVHLGAADAPAGDPPGVWSEGPALPPPPPPVGGPPIPPPPPITPDDHDGLTRAGVASTDEFARVQPGIPGQPLAPSVTRPVARLVMSSGDTVEVDRVVLIGRAPEARRFTATEQPRLVTVPSPLHEISSTHVEVRPGSGADHGSAVVTDMGSTNGTVLVQPGLGPEDLKPGIAVQLIPGAIINLGDGVTIQVTNP